MNHNLKPKPNTDELSFSEQYNKLKQQNQRQKTTPSTTEYQPSIPQNMHRHELITDLSDSIDRFTNTLTTETNLTQSTNNIVVKARKLLPIIDDTIHSTGSTKSNGTASNDFSTYKSVSSLSIVPPKNANYDISMPKGNSTLPKVTLVRNASQHNLTTVTPTTHNSTNNLTQLPAIKATNVSVPIVLNTHSFSSAPNKSINFTSEQSNFFSY